MSHHLIIITSLMREPCHAVQFLCKTCERLQGLLFIVDLQGLERLAILWATLPALNLNTCKGCSSWSTCKGLKGLQSFGLPFLL
eukprot:1159898-Pelagomonas_calceolata.AAC.6